ncbi:S66 peptidase family protein [Moorella sp. Hama-1]|uniref:S66 peptidase family protein n=1 Tax=Moorella sp. Hama-1 TaxID=2138101 RepID=UPI0019145C5B|nr:LD-carboxypeptidase [Moorella sp. Hama-1]BCV20734.1 peptidase U61 [Moorella sp. Hama-1]
MTLKPPALQKGATVGIIAPASPLPDPGYLERGLDFWRQRGYRIRTGDHINEVNGYLAGSDDRRLADLHRMFRDPEVQAIVCLRGGYGSLRLLAYLDYGLIAAHPKILVGYSDITALHLAINKKTGLVTFHGPMIYPELGCQTPSPYTAESLLRTLTATEPPGPIPTAPGMPAAVTINPGQARGIVTGGNLSLVVATLGTPYEIDTRGKILFLEEVDEAPYRLDRMLTQLHLAGKLYEAAGIVCGHCVGRTDPPRQAPGPAPATTNPSNPSPIWSQDLSPEAAAREVITARLRPTGRPCFYGLPAGHITHQVTLPLGIHACLDAEACTLTYLETATAPA